MSFELKVEIRVFLSHKNKSFEIQTLFCSLVAVFVLYFKHILTKNVDKVFNEQEVENKASIWFHIFSTLLYLAPLLVAYLADTVLGRLNTLMSVSAINIIGIIILIFGSMSDKEKRPNEIPEM